MKKTMKKLLAAVFTLAILMTSVIGASAFTQDGNIVTLKDVVDMYWWSYQGYNRGEKGPFSISQAVLVQNGKRTPVYFVAVAGYEDIGNGNDKNATFLSAFNLNNGYTERVKTKMLENVPQGSNIFFLGDSLGGYVVQQLAADNDIKYNYNVIQTTTIGAPEVAVGKKEGNVSRIMDFNDLVPTWMGLETNARFLHKYENAVVARNGNFSIPTAYAHASYTDRETWGAYDVCGKKNGGAYLLVDVYTTTFYRVPYDASLSFISQESEIRSGAEDDPNNPENYAVSYGE
ncbi:MAG: hypothetical protein IJ133_05245 [Clostridia bacterium]|nr:hypothetical protein [Clostridia bacterium]